MKQGSLFATKMSTLITPSVHRVGVDLLHLPFTPNVTPEFYSTVQLKLFGGKGEMK